MKTEISRAFIMRTKEFGESDLLATFFTPHRGLLKGVAKAARRSRKRFVNCFGSFSLVNLEYVIKREGDLAFIHSGKLINGYPGLRANFSSISKASFIVELTQVLFPSGVPDQRVFELLEQCLAHLDAGERSDLIPLFFEARAMKLGGYEVNLEKCAVCGRSYQGEGAAVFRPDKGGIACKRCEHPSSLHPLMKPEAVALLRRLQEGFLSSEGMKDTPGEAIQQVRDALELHREYRLEKRLKTSKYLVG